MNFAHSYHELFSFQSGGEGDRALMRPPAVCRRTMGCRSIGRCVGDAQRSATARLCVGIAEGIAIAVSKTDNLVVSLAPVQCRCILKYFTKSMIFSARNFSYEIS